MALAAKVFPNGIVRVGASGDDLKLVAQIPYLRPDGQCWATWWTYAADLRRELGDRLHFREGSADALRELTAEIERARFGNNDEVRAWFSAETTPRPFQMEAIHFGLARKRVCIADGVGLGKTVESLGIMLGTFARGLIRRAVIVVPASLRSQWFRELQQHSNPSVLPAAVKLAVGPRPERLEIYKSAWQVLILSYEAVRADRAILVRLAPSVGLVILDEASAIRNPGQGTDAIFEVFAATPYKIALTATPIENGLHDLYSVLRWVDPKTFMSKKHFDTRYVVWKRQYYKVKMRIGKTFTRKNLVPKRYQNLIEVRAKMRPVFIRRTAQEVAVQLPAVTVTRELLELGERQRAVYDLVKERTKDEVKELHGEQLLAPLQALRQCCDSIELVAEGAGQRASVKVDRLLELLSGEFRGEQVLIFTDYERFARILERDLRAHQPVMFTGKMSRVDRGLALDLFTRGRRRVLIMTEAGERGLNLQVSGVIVLADIPWNPAAIKQRIGRARRIGSKHSVVRVRCLVAADTVEEKLILPKVDLKQQLSLDVVGADELSRTVPLEGLSGAKASSLL